jgi:hypothetical protein
VARLRAGWVISCGQEGVREHRPGDTAEPAGEAAALVFVQAGQALSDPRSRLRTTPTIKITIPG